MANPLSGVPAEPRPARRRVLGDRAAITWVVVLVVVFLTALVMFLALPGAPGESEFLSFEGFVPLPRSGMLSALDYLTFNDGQVYVASISSGELLDVSLGAGGGPSGAGVRRAGGGGSAHGIAIAAPEQVGFITRADLNVVDAFDLRTLRVIERISVPEGPDAIIYDPRSNLIYVASGAAKAATLIDAKERSIVGSIRLSGEPEFAAVDPTNGLIYQALRDTNTVVVIDPLKGSVVNTWRLDDCDAPSGVAIGPSMRRLFVVCSSGSTLSVLNLDTAKRVASIPVGRLSDSVVLDESLKRVYVAGGAGQLTLIQGDESDGYGLLGNVATHPGAHTLALDPRSHKLYLAYSGILGSPRLAVFSARR